MSIAEQEMQRRKIYQAMLEQAVGGSKPYDVVSGRVVPNIGDPIANIAKAYMARKGIEESEAREKQAGMEESQAYQDALTTMQGIPGMAEGSKSSAISQMIGDERIGSDTRQKIAQTLIEKELGLGKSKDNYGTIEADASGNLWRIPAYGGPAEPVLGPDNKQLTRATASASLQADIAAERERRKLEEQMRVQAERDRQAAEAARLEAEAKKRGEGAGIEATQDILAEAKRREEAAKASGKITGETEAKQGISESKFEGYYEEAMNLLNQDPTESGLGAAFDAAGAFIGYSPKGAATQDSLKVVAANLTGLVPRFEGPQSDKDTQLYKEAAAQVGLNIPVERRKAALNTMKSIMERNKKSGTFKGFGDQEAPKKRLKYNRQTGKME